MCADWEVQLCRPIARSFLSGCLSDTTLEQAVGHIRSSPCDKRCGKFVKTRSVLIILTLRCLDAESVRCRHHGQLRLPDTGLLDSRSSPS